MADKLTFRYASGKVEGRNGKKNTINGMNF
jgi:hypothetical protein